MSTERVPVIIEDDDSGEKQISSYKPFFYSFIFLCVQGCISISLNKC